MEEGEDKKFKLTAKKADNLTDWYTQVIINSEFVDYSAVSGMLVYRPGAYFAWDTIKEATDAMFKAAGVRDVYFPLFIPERFLEKEKEHVKGFLPKWHGSRMHARQSSTRFAKGKIALPYLSAAGKLVMLPAPSSSGQGPRALDPRTSVRIRSGLFE